MEKPDIISSEVLDILLRLHAGRITPQDAMALLVPYLLDCDTPKQLALLEPAKEHIMSWMNN